MKDILQINAGEAVEKKKPSYTIGGEYKFIATMENSLEVSEKTKNKIII